MGKLGLELEDEGTSWPDLASAIQANPYPGCFRNTIRGNHLIYFINGFPRSFRTCVTAAPRQSYSLPVSVERANKHVGRRRTNA